VTTQIITAENLKKTIDALVKEGAQAFVLSTDKHGDAHAPSKKVNLYRIPCAVDGEVFEKSNLSAIFYGLYIVPVKNIGDFSELAKTAYNKNLEREKDE
jgi:hypothetical protein